jgi:hypothetical protein
MNLNIPLVIHNKSRIVKAICRFCLIDSIVLCINDFKNGLYIHNILKFCKNNSVRIKRLFEFDSSKFVLTAAKIRELFNIEVKRSDDNVLLFQRKLRTMKFFIDYLNDIESNFQK